MAYLDNSMDLGQSVVGVIVLMVDRQLLQFIGSLAELRAIQLLCKKPEGRGESSNFLSFLPTIYWMPSRTNEIYLV